MYNSVLARIEDAYLEPTEKIVCCECDMCGGEIYDGDDCYELLGFTICESCIEDSRCYAESEEK